MKHVTVENLEWICKYYVCKEFFREVDRLHILPALNLEYRVELYIKVLRKFE